MIKLIEGGDPKELEMRANNWILDQENDKRNIEIINFIPSMITRPKAGGMTLINNAREVEVIFQGWIIYKWKFHGLHPSSDQTIDRFRTPGAK